MGKMPNLRQEQAAETRMRLMSAARELFARDGYSATSVRAIHRAVGRADGILYHYFPGGKEELLRSLIEEEVQTIGDEMQRCGEGLENLPLEEALERIYRQAAATLEQHGELLSILFRDEAARHVIDQAKIERLLQQRQKWLPDFLRHRAETGEIRELDYECAAVTLVALMMDHFLIELSGMGPGELHSEAHRQRMVRFHVSMWKRQQD